jgi:hypothetical protein
MSILNVAQLGSTRSPLPSPQGETRGCGRALHCGGSHRALGATSLSLQDALCASVAGRLRYELSRADPAARNVNRLVNDGISCFNG